MNGLNDTAANTGAARTHALELNFPAPVRAGLHAERVLHADVPGESHVPRERVRDACRPSGTPATRPARTASRRRGIYELPFGKGRAYLQSGLLNHILGGWQVAVTYEYQPGPLLAWGNIFYGGDLDTFAEDVTANDPTLEQWFDTSLPFERASANQPAAFQARVFPRFFDGVRADGLNQWNLNVLRRVRLTDRVRLELRADFINLLNRSQMNPPDLGPTSTNFGRITSQTSSLNRFFQVQARLLF